MQTVRFKLEYAKVVLVLCDAAPQIRWGGWLPAREPRRRRRAHRHDPLRIATSTHVIGLRQKESYLLNMHVIVSYMNRDRGPSGAKNIRREIVREQ